MARTGMVNVGQLVREAHGAGEVVLAGFASYRGSVIAATAWDAPMQQMAVPPARDASWEEIMHRAGAANKLLIMRGAQEPAETHVTRGHRAIGVVYDPAYEAFGNYVPTVLPRRYDAMLYVHPLHMRARVDGEVPETFPTGV
jgi:erythromycin esterase